MTRKPHVTIAIPTYNGAAYLAKSVESALNQNYESFEVLILDNASTDGTAEIVAAFVDPRLSYLRFETNVGLAGNVKRGCELAKGDYLVFLGADDILLANYVGSAAAFLDSESSVSLVHGPAFWIDAGGRRFGGTGHTWERITPGASAMRGAFVQGFCFASMMMRTSAIRATGPFDGHWREVIDLWLFLRMCLAGDVGYLPDILCEYRVHDEAMSMPMYSENLMFRRQMAAAAEAFAWPEAVAIGAGRLRREAERAAARIAIETLHLARSHGRRKYLRNFREVIAAAPEALLWPQTWARFAFAMLPIGAIQYLTDRKRARSVGAISPEGTRRQEKRAHRAAAP